MASYIAGQRPVCGLEWKWYYNQISASQTEECWTSWDVLGFHCTTQLNQGALLLFAYAAVHIFHKKTCLQPAGSKLLRRESAAIAHTPCCAELGVSSWGAIRSGLCITEAHIFHSHSHPLQVSRGWLHCKQHINSTWNVSIRIDLCIC